MTTWRAAGDQLFEMRAKRREPIAGDHVNTIPEISKVFERHDEVLPPTPRDPPKGHPGDRFRGWKRAASLFIRKLITVGAVVSAAVAAAIPGTIIAATVPTATVATAGLRSIDPAARWRRRRRDIGLAAAAALARVIAAAPISVPDAVIATAVVAICFGPGRNSGGSECENCRGHDGYPAEFQHHETSPVICLAVSPHLDRSLPTETSNKAQAGISGRLSRDIARYG
jgi:hypothetical protein